MEVAIRPGPAAGEFRVEVVASPAGEASAVVELDTGALTARRELLQQAVLASSVSSRRLLPESERPLREAGEALFAALLGTGPLAGRYQAAATVAAERGQGLRLVLRLDTPALAALPWEAMYDRGAGSYVCRRDQLVRHVPVASVPAPLRVRSPLRILGVVSAPRGLSRLNVAKERDQLGRALARPVSQGLAELHWAPSATWAGLHDLLLEDEWHVLHFIGHGDFDPGLDEGVLALEREDDGRADMVAAHRIVDLLRQARPMPRLVVLNACSGGATGASDLFSSTAASLVRGGVSAVAAMQYEISDSAAAVFARGFYAAIARGRGVDDAVSSGRVAILGLSDRTLEWVTPVLYLRGHDAQLFSLAGPAAAAGREDRDTAGPGSPRRVPAERGAAGFPQAPQAPAPGPGPVRGAARRSPAAARPPRLVRALFGHASYVTAVAFSPDGSLLATASGDRTARLWDTATGASARPLSGHDEGVSAVAFSPDGSLLATVSGDRTARLWQVPSGAPLRVTRTGHASYASAVAFSPGGAQFATAGWDPVVRLWDLDDDAAPRTFTGLGRELFAVAFSPDGSLLAAAASDGTAQVWDVATGAPARTLTGHRELVSGVAFSPDGSLLATASADGTARLWDAAAGAALHVLAGHDHKVLGLAFSPDGSLLATGGEDRTARLWEVAGGTLLDTLAAHDRSVAGVAFSPDGSLLATASADRTARLWRLP